MPGNKLANVMLNEKEWRRKEDDSKRVFKNSWSKASNGC